MRISLQQPPLALRRALSEIVDAGDSADQERLVAALAGEYRHSIRRIQSEVCADASTRRLNCHAFTFGLHRSPRFFELIRERDVWPTGKFVGTLLGLSHEKPLERAADGDAVVYESGGSIAHSGILAGALVQSKWGTGHVWEHAPFETPLLYGNRCRIFGRPDAGFAGRVFEQFVANQRAAARRWG